MIKKISLAGLILFLFLSLLLLRSYVFSTGLAQRGDLMWMYSSKLYARHTWHQVLQEPRVISELLVYIWLFLLPPEISQRLIFVLIFTIAGSSAFFATFKLIKNRSNERTINHAFLAALIAGLIYVINPITVIRITHLFLLWGYAFLPLLFYFTHKATHRISIDPKRKILRDSVPVALVWSLMSGVPHWSVMSLVIILLLSLFAVSRPLKDSLLKLSLFLGCTVALYVGMSSFWIIPYLRIILERGVTSPHVFTLEALRMLSRNASLLNVIRLRGNWWPTDLFDLSFPWTHIYSIASLIIPLVTFSTLLSHRKRRIVVLLSSLAILSILLATGVQSPFSKFYEWLCFRAPIASMFGWIFRDPDKWAMLIPLSYSLLSGMTIYIFLHRKGFAFKKSIGIILSMFILSSAFIAGFPLLTGDVRGALKPRDLPTDYVYIYSWIEQQDPEGTYKTAVWPKRPPWGAPNAKVKEDFYHRQIRDLVKENRTKYLGKELGFLNVRYLLFREDVATYEDANRITSNLLVQKDLELMVHEGSLWLFENSHCAEILNIPQQCVLVFGGLEKLTSLNSMNSFTPLNSCLIFSNQAQQRELQNNIAVIVLNDGLNDLVLSLAHNGYIIKPFDFTNRHNPSRLWSKASTNDQLHGPWHPYLESRGIDSWDFDYGRGIVFTWAPSKLEKPTPTSADLIKVWNFDDTKDLNQWKEYTRDSAIHSITLEDGMLKAELWNSTWGWKTINSPLISAEYGNWYRWELQIKGENAHSVHIKIVEYNQEQKIISAYHVKSIGSGNFTWQTITIDYTLQNPETKYLQLQVWHGHQTTQPLPNKIWIDDVKVYDLQRFVESVSLEIPFTVPETDEYILLTRLFHNQQGGKIQIQLDNKEYIINTKDQLNKFTWQQIDTLNLTKGNHKITLTNLEGFNAVNLFALIPKQEYQNAQNQMEQLLRNKRIIYILEAETDLYHQNTTVSNKYGGEASNGRVLELSLTSKAYKTIEIINPGNYTLAIRSKGNLTIKIDEEEYRISSPQLNWTYIGSPYLDKGNHTIEITNPINPLYEWNFNSADDLYQWKNYTRENQFDSLYTLTLDNSALKAELWNSTWGWKTINSLLIPVTPETTYQLDFYVAGENAHGVHAKIVEYDSNKTLLSAKIMSSIGSGNFTWKNINFKYTPSQNASYIQLQIWHGHETTQPLPNKIWIDNVKVYKYYEPSDLDVVWIYSTQNSNETLEDIFTPKENPAEIISYQKIDPTKYIVKGNATKPFMLSFAESYDPLWVAYVNGQKISSIPLYGVINGFYINQTGLLDITIEYEPQKWFYYGSIISLTTLIACTAYLTLTHPKTKHTLQKLKQKLKTKKKSRGAYPP